MYEPYNFTYIDQNLCLVLNSTNSDGKLSQRWRTASVRTQTLGAIPVFKPLTGQCILTGFIITLNPGLFLFFFQKHFLGQFSLIFIEHRIINLLTKRIELNLLYKLSYLNSNFALFKPCVILNVSSRRVLPAAKP